MATILLVLPRLLQPMGAPYLGQQLLASALLARGHRVVVLDLAAPRGPSPEEAVAVAEALRPDIIGFTLFTVNAAKGYALAPRLAPHTGLLVAGGPHVTACPSEPLRFGFHVTVAGEGELTLGALADAIDRGEAPPRLAGVMTRDGGLAPEPIADLDALPFALDGLSLYPAAWYGLAEAPVPAGLMTSRGCPARCTFCANYVTGRAYRYRSPANVVAEMVALRERYDARFFPFWDDAFTALRPRLNAVCDAISSEPRLAGVTWSAITPGNMVKPFDLERMRQAGCVAVNFGIESGDADVLRSIQKGQRPEHIEAAVAAAKAAGMRTIVNFMFGFPGEGVRELDTTLALMRSLAPNVDYFNNRGVLMPFPGTQIYDEHKDRYGFAEWWLDDARIVPEPDYSRLTPLEIERALEHDPTLDLGFFDYEPDVRAKIAECVRFKAQHNARTVARQRAQLGLGGRRG